MVPWNRTILLPLAVYRSGSTSMPSGGTLAFVVAEAVSLLLPGVSEHVIAAALPEAGRVLGPELDALDPLGGLPGVQARDDQAQRAAVVQADRRPVVGVGEE